MLDSNVQNSDMAAATGIRRPLEWDLLLLWEHFLSAFRVISDIEINTKDNRRASVGFTVNLHISRHLTVYLPGRVLVEAWTILRKPFGGRIPRNKYVG